MEDAGEIDQSTDRASQVDGKVILLS